MLRATHAGADVSPRGTLQRECKAARGMPGGEKACGQSGLAVPVQVNRPRNEQMPLNYAFVEKCTAVSLPRAEEPDRLVALEQIKQCAQRFAPLAGKHGIARENERRIVPRGA
jgi:hypothetical protein